MKKLFLIAAVMMVSFLSMTAKAQLNVNVNIGSQPLWGPTGYDHVDYYYLPDVDSYYYVPKKQFVYLEGSKWTFANSLPARYSNYDLYKGYKVVVNKERPYLQNNTYVTEYAKYKNYGGRQGIIRDSNEEKYYVVKGHPHGMPPGQAKKIYSNHSVPPGQAKKIYNKKWKKEKGHDNDYGKGKWKH